MGIQGAFATDIVYTNNSDGGKLYLKSSSDTSNGTAITSINGIYPIYSPDGTKILYTNVTDGGKLYLKSSSDTSNGTAITSHAGYKASFSPDGLYIIYPNGNDGSKLYRKSSSDTSNGTAITTTSVRSAMYSPDGLYIVFAEYTYSYTLFKKSALDSLLGSQILSGAYGDNPIFSPDGTEIIYQNASDSNRLYKKSAFNTSIGTAITSYGTDKASFSPDGTEIIYSSSAIYKKSSSDTSNGTAITTGISTEYPQYKPGPTYSCATPIPSGGNYGTLTYSPTSINQSWVYDGYGSGSCSYTCTGGYSGSGCTIPEYIPPAVNGSCGAGQATYGYSATTYYTPLCSVGTSSGATFPSAGGSTSYQCMGQYGGTNATCYMNRQQYPFSCSSVIPSGGNYGTLTYSPTSINQSWVYGQIGNSCSYSCLNGYTGSGCLTAPVAEGGSTTDVGFWQSLIAPFTGFFSDIMDWLKKMVSFKTMEAPYGIIFSGSSSPLNIGISGNAIGCGVVNTGAGMQYCWEPTGKLFGESKLENGLWKYNWDYRNYNQYSGQCYVSGQASSGSLNPENIIQNGKFTYLKDTYGREITVSNIITVSEEYTVLVKPKYDIILFGFSLVDGLNSVIDIVVFSVRYVVKYTVLASGNILDLISMFFYDYQDAVPNSEHNACYFGSIFPMKSTMTETGITHTQNNGLLDVLFLLVFSFGAYKLIIKRLG